MSREHNLTGLQLQNILALINLQSQLVIPCKGAQRAYSVYSMVWYCFCYFRQVVNCNSSIKKSRLLNVYLPIGVLALSSQFNSLTYSLIVNITERH